MGICDIIPGISGGTIALITGIYQDFIESVKNINYKNIKQTLTKNFLKKIKEYKFDFLLKVLFGILSAIILVSKLIKYLLENEQIYTLSFFVGLILASSIFILKEIKDKKITNKLFIIFGIIFAFIISQITPTNVVNPTYFYIFLSGVLGISAMFLPGISGAFILLILGTYQYIISALHNFQIKELAIFGIGVISGAVIISRIIHFLFKKFKNQTLYFLFGLVLGALIIPSKIILNNFKNSNIYLTFLFIIIGFLIVFLLEKIGNKKLK